MSKTVTTRTATEQQAADERAGAPSHATEKVVSAHPLPEREVVDTQQIPPTPPQALEKETLRARVRDLHALLESLDADLARLPDVIPG